MSARQTEALAPAPFQPRQLGRYTLLEPIGEGAMGVVYRAHDPQLNRTVALKTLRKSLLATEASSIAATIRLRNEAQAAARLSHPGIVSVYEYGEDGDETFIAMEFVRGTPLLAGMVKPEGLPLDDVLCLMVQLLAALQCAHEQGVWHRDIKPANLMITPAGRLKIADFGIARIDAQALTLDATVMGSPGYMAPECYAGGAIDQRADLYACGVLLYELLTGARPFRGAPDVVMYKTLHLPVPPMVREDTPGSAALACFEPVVQRALSKGPTQRYLSALEMREDLTRVAGRAIPNALSPRAMAMLAPGLAAEVATAPSRPSTPTPSATPSALPTTPSLSTVADTLARLLVDELGPVARCLVQRVATTQPGLDAHELVVRVAQAALPASQQQAFVDNAKALIGAPAHASAAAQAEPSRPGTGATMPVLGHSALDPAFVQAAQTMVARHIGPIAGWMARRAADGQPSREQFIARFASLVAEGRDRDRLLAALCKLR